MTQIAPSQFQPPFQPTPGGNPDGGRRRWSSLRTTAVALLIALSFQIAFGLPAWTGLRAEFTNSHAKLPPVTVLYLDLADLWNEQFGWAIGWGLAIVLAIVVTLVRPPPKPPTLRGGLVKSLLAAAVVLLVFIVVVGLAAMVLFTPARSLHEGDSGGLNGGGK